MPLGKRCFVIMPFSQTSVDHTEAYWTSFFTSFLKPHLEKLGYSCFRSQAKPSEIIRDVLHELCGADLVIAILTDHNANVWYELGIRHVLSKGTIMMMEKAQPLPFDISHYGTLIYEDSITAAFEFERNLSEFVERIETDRPIDGPVTEFLGEDVNAALERRRESLTRELKEKYDKDSGDIKKAVEEQPERPAAAREAVKQTRRVLWVDDYPGNNLALIDHYRPLGIIFDLALNTKQALDFLEQGDYALIISDIARGSDWEAGLRMIPEIRSRFPKGPPIVIYAHPDAVKAHGEKAMSLGAALATSSPQELIPWLEDIVSGTKPSKPRAGAASG